MTMKDTYGHVFFTKIENIFLYKNHQMEHYLINVVIKDKPCQVYLTGKFNLYEEITTIFRAFSYLNILLKHSLYEDKIFARDVISVSMAYYTTVIIVGHGVR